jgi:putative FmdB family regulatory protein
MPTYEYVCDDCGTTHDIVQAMTDPTLTDCPACGKPALRKLFTNVGVVFKGSGFYRTDSRDKPAASTSTEKKADKPAEKKADTAAPAKPKESKPAKKD